MTPAFTDMRTGLDFGYAAPSCRLQGVARSVIFHPQGYSLWQVSGVLDSGAEIQWRQPHGDEALYVIEGSLEVGSEVCRAGGVVILESGVKATLRAREAARVAHFGPAEPAEAMDGMFGSPERHGRAVHILDPTEARRLRFTNGLPVTVHMFADSTCSRCRITLFRIDSGPRGSESHFHSEDEIIHMLEGAIQVGPLLISSGMSIAIPAGRRYGFRTQGPYAFLNYRRDASTTTLAPGTAPILETVSGYVSGPLKDQLELDDGGGGRLVVGSTG
jgi:quercetin dioxygenase-like cupin family protein